MKNVLYILVLVLSFSCSTNNVTMTFDDEKSNAIRSHYQNYLKNDVPA